MTEIKKKYNHLSIESEFLKKNYFQKIYSTKKTPTKWDMVITQLPISITKDTSLESITGILKEDILATYQRMK